MKATKVADIGNADYGWNQEALNQWLPKDVLQCIAPIMPPSIDADPDVRIGVGQDGKHFSVGAMYMLLDDRGESTSSMPWKDI